MIREIELTAYLPPFMKDCKEVVEALKAENIELINIWKYAEGVLNNRFISTADEYGISRFENLLGIFSEADETLETRRIRVQNRWFSRLPYTIRVLIEKLQQIMKCEFAVWTDFKEGYVLQLTVFTLDDGIQNELEYTFDVIMPMNIIVKAIYEGTVGGNMYYGGVICESEIITLQQGRN